MRRFWMRSLTGQWIALTLVALAASQILFYYIYRAEQGRTVLELRRDEFLGRAAAVARLMNTVDPGFYSEILRAANELNRTILPFLCRYMTGKIAREPINALVRLRSMFKFQTSRGISSIRVLPLCPPTIWIQTSTRLYFSNISFTVLST